DRTAIDALVGLDLWVQRQRVRVNTDQEFLWDDLEDREVVDCDGKVISRLVEVYNAGAADIAVVSDQSKGTLEIALVPDYFNMNFDGDGPLRLVVREDLFADLWLEPSP